MAHPERSPHERETLHLPNPEAARSWQEKLSPQLEQAKTPGVDARREAVADAVAQEFAAAGEGVSIVREPWDHTPEEHAEAQQLVDLAFAKDLNAALRSARQSPHYPRNLDLFHDVLTSELYELVREHQLHRQPLGAGIIATAAVVLVIFFLILIVFLL